MCPWCVLERPPGRVREAARGWAEAGKGSTDSVPASDSRSHRGSRGMPEVAAVAALRSP